MIANLKKTYAYLLHARKRAATADDLVKDFRATEAPILTLIAQNCIELKKDDAIDLEIETALFDSTAALIKEALSDAESSARAATKIYAQVESLRRMNIDAVDETADSFGKAIDNAVMRSEEVQVLWDQLEGSQRKLLALLPSV